jgi:hypothetical protein
MYICHNIKASLNQTSARLVADVLADKKDKKILKFLSNGEDSEDVSFFDKSEGVVSELSQYPDTYLGMLVLAHPSRFKKNHILSILNSLRWNSFYSEIYIYFDEFDQYTKAVIGTLDVFCAFEKVKRYELISATVMKSQVLKHLGDIPASNVIDLWVDGSFDSNYYITYEESEKAGHLITIDSKNLSFFDFIATCFIKYLTTETTNSKTKFYGFVPSHFKKADHFDLAKFFAGYGITVCVMNSDHKGFLYPDIEFEDDGRFSEPADQILYYKNKHNIKKIIVTGNLCIGRSVTLQKEGLVFDFAIYHDEVVSNCDQAYQLDRTKGNLKRFTTKMPIILCTPKYKKWVTTCEKFIIEMATEGVATNLSVLECKKQVELEQKNLPYNCDFIECNKDTFNEIKHQIPGDHRNPFIKSEKVMIKNGWNKYPGNIRTGSETEWRIIQFSEISEDRGWGMKDSISRIKVCYKDDKLGISVVTHSSI